MRILNKKLIFMDGYLELFNSDFRNFVEFSEQKFTPKISRSSPEFPDA